MYMIVRAMAACASCLQPLKETLTNSPALWRSGGVRIKARFRRRSGATSRKRNAEASAA